MKLSSYAQDRWIEARDGFVEIASAVDGRTVALASSAGLDFAGMVRHAKRTGGPALRAMTFHERAARLKALAVHLDARKDDLYERSFDTGSTRRDHLFDIDGGIGTLFAFASRGRRELPDERFVLEGPPEMLTKRNTFAGRHVLAPLHGVSVAIDAYNFPCWGFLEKFAPAFLAGVPTIVKPATATAYVTHAVVRHMLEAGVLPPGTLQLVVGSLGDLFEHLDGQDVVSFTGSLETSLALRNHRTIAEKAVRFVAERDSLNAAILAPDAVPGTPEFDLFIGEVVREMTVKAGQKCTAIRRALVPRALYEAAAETLRAKLAEVVVGDPRVDATTMGPVVSRAQRDDVRERVRLLATEASPLFGDPATVDAHGADAERGAFLAPLLLGCERPVTAERVHDTEAFGPVSTLMAYDGIAEAVSLAELGGGSLVASVYTYDAKLADELVFGIAPFHGRLAILDRDCARGNTGHGSPLPGLIHGGPGRAGGGEELGGLRGVFHFMQRTALQASPARLSSLTHTWMSGAPTVPAAAHPFTRTFDELTVGESVVTPSRTVTLEDIEHFADFTGDRFYAHMDDEAARANPFFPGRVAHGYLILSFAAGLFVEPSPGPVLANYGLENLRFQKPVSPGDAIAARLTVKAKTPRKPEYGEVRWDVEVVGPDGEVVASYELLTMNATDAGLPAAFRAKAAAPA